MRLQETNTHFEFKAAGLHRPPSDSVHTFVVIITSVNKEPGVIILHVNGKDITSALRINSKVNRMNRVNLSINSPAPQYVSIFIMQLL